MSECGLAFRGDELFGSKRNGNFLGILELIAKFDSFLSAHIEKHKTLQSQGKSRGSVSYLSSTVCEELIEIMGDHVLTTIISELKQAKYFAVSIDPTPDVTHIDRLTCILRYIPPDGDGPVERFVKFLDTESHKAKDLAGALLNFFESVNIDISLCRGQSYDNASNMAGKYAGVQAIIKEKCPEAMFVPCLAHSLNLVGEHTSTSLFECVAFFDFIQKLYTFFSASTYRWGVLSTKLKEKS